MLATVNWVGGSGDWNTGANWSNGVGPGAGDDAVIDVPGTITVTHSSGSHTIQSLLASDGFTLSGGTLDVTQNLSGSGPLTLAGGTLRNATIPAGTTLAVSNSGNNVLDQVTLNGTLDSATNNGSVLVRNGMTLGGTINLGNTAGSTTGSFNIQGSAPLLGTGTVVVGGHASNYFGCRFNGETTTLGAGITLQGSRGQIGFSGCNLINQGTIEAVPGVGIDVHFGPGGGTSNGQLRVSGGTMSLFESWNATSTTLTSGSLNLGGTFTQANLGTFTRATGGTAGTVSLNGTLNGGLMLSNATGSWFLNGTLSGGVLDVAPGSDARLIVTGGSPQAVNVAINGGLDMESINFARLAFGVGSTLNQTLQLGDAAGLRRATLFVSGNGTLDGNGTIVMGGAPNIIQCLTNFSTTTIGPGITIRGKSGSIGAGLCPLINQGSIVADTSGGSIGVEFGTAGNQSNGHLGVSGGQLVLSGAWDTDTLSLTSGDLVLGGTFTQANLGTFTRAAGGNAGTVSVNGTMNGGLMLSNATGSWFLNGTLSGGVLDVAPGSAARLIATGGSPQVVNVAINGGLDMESINFARLTFGVGSTLNQTLQLGDAAGLRRATLFVSGNGTLDGNGTIVMGGAPNIIQCLTNFSTTTIGPGITIRGKSGSIGAGLCPLINQGSIVADTSGGSIGVEFGTAGNQSNGHLGVSGGQLVLSGAWDTDTLSLTSGDLILGGTFTQANLGTFVRAMGGTAGTVSMNGTLNGGMMLSNSTGSWFLNGTLSGGVLDVAPGSAARLIATGGSPQAVNVTINGGMDMESINFARLFFGAGSTLNQTLQLGDAAGLRRATILVPGNGTLDGNGTIVMGGAPNVIQCLTNFSTTTIGPGITIRGKSGTIGAGLCPVVNHGTIAADGGGTISVENTSNFASGTLTGGIWKAIGSSTLRILNSNITTNAASITVDGAAARITRDFGSTSAITDLSSVSTLGSFALRNGANFTTAGPFDNQGTLVVGPASTFSVNGTLTEGNDASLGIEIGGTPASGQFGHVAVSGAAILGGSLDVTLANGYGPATGQLYTPITYASKSNSFSAIHVPMFGPDPAFNANVAAANVTVTSLLDAPDLAPTSLHIPASVNVGDTVNFVYSVQNSSTTTISAHWTDSVYLSADNLLDPGDVLLGGVTRIATLAGGESYSATLTVLIPSLGLGNYHVIVVADSGLEVPDSTRTNNTLVSPNTMSIAVDSHPLVLNQRIQGMIESHYSVDHWTFGAVQNQQIQFDLLSSAPNAAKFTLRGPNNYVAFSDATADSSLITLPTSGDYRLEVQSANGFSFGAYAFQVNETSQELLSLGSTFHGSIPGTGFAKLFRVDLTASTPLRIVVDGANSSDRIEVFARAGSAPNRQVYDIRNTSLGADHTLAVPLGVPGSFYILVYAEHVVAASTFSIRVDAVPLSLASVAPTSLGQGATSIVTLHGLGLRPGTSVQLIPSAGGTTIASNFVSVDSTSQVTAFFDLSQAAIGTYHVRATVPDGTSSMLNDAFQIVQGVGQLETFPVLPAALGRHAVATLYIEYANVGTATMAAPILTLQSNDPDDSDRPLMTLDASRVVGGFWTSAIPDGFANSVQVVGNGASPGVLQPGERLRIPVYYVGLQQPWDLSDTQVEFAVSVHEAGDPSAIDWPALSNSLRPDYIQPEAWSPVYANLQAEVGTTWGDYVSMISDNASYLGRLGQRVSDISQLFGFELRQASGIDPEGTLESRIDATVPTPGLRLEFIREFGTSINERYQEGPFGRGWIVPWQQNLELGADGTLILHTSADSQRRFQPDSRSNGVYFSQSGDNAKMRQVSGGAFELTETNGLVTRFFADGRLERQRDTNGNTITAGYTNNRLMTLTHSSGAMLTIAYNAAGRIASVTDSLGRITSYGYDATNAHLMSVTSSAGTTTYGYSLGQGASKEHALTSIGDPTGVTRFFEYDARGRLTATSVEGNIQRTTYAYGTSGDVTVTDSSGVTSKLYFDANGLLARSEDATGYFVGSRFDHDLQIIGTTDAIGRTTSVSYTTSGAARTLIDAQNNTTTFFPTGPFNQNMSFDDARGNTTRYTYDIAGNLTSTIYADATSEHTTFDSHGTPDVSTNRRGQTIDRTMNSAGQVTHEVRSDGTTFDYTYDLLGRLATATDASGTTTLSYDTADRLTRVDYPNGRSLQYTYDAAGRRTRLQDQSGFAVQYAYDSVGRLETVRNASNALIVQYTYDAAGRVSREDKGNGTRTDYTFDSAGRVTQIAHREPGGAVSAQLDYTFDSAGRLATATTADGTWTYIYDLTDQLIRALFSSTNGAISNQDLNYEYDALGNRVRTVLNGASTNYASNSLNQYTGAGSTTFSYDADGNLIQETGPSGTRLYTYDLLNRLTRVQSPQGVWDYEYDVLGNRKAVVANGQRTEYLIDPTGLGDVTAEYSGAGELTAHYPKGISLASRVDAGGAASYYNFDSLGSSVQLTGSTGVVQNTYGYTPFGDLLNNTGSTANPFTFVGADGVMQEGNGLYFMRARMYSPGLGRFVQQDPIRLAAGDFNLQRYVGNNPTNQVDPSGLVNRGDKSPQQQCLDYGGKPQYHRDTGYMSCRFPPPTPSPPYPVPKPPPPPPRPPQPPDCLGPYCFSPGGGGTAGSIDPNEKFGGAGFGPQAFVNGDEIIPYQVHFENLGPGTVPTPTNPATAPAQRIEVTDQLSTNLDWNTFEFTEFGFGDTVVPVSGLAGYQFASVPVSSNGQDFNVEVELTFDATTGRIRVLFQAIDPSTQLPPDVLTGILPPEDGTGRGKGYVNYRVRPVAGLPTGTEIRNIAYIKFDGNAIIATNQINPEDPSEGTDPNREALNTIDAGPPTSFVVALPPTSPTSFLVSWIGADDFNGSGVASFDIFVSIDGGAFVLWLDDTTSLSAPFTGELGYTYAFYSVATDNVGRVESAPLVPDTTTLTNTYFGDFNGDGAFDGADIDALVAAIASGQPSLNFDLTFDGFVNLADRNAWLELSGAVNLPSGNSYRLGDANLDGVVDGQDFIVWNSNKFSAIAAWTAGDFDANGLVDGQDFIIWNSNKFTSADLEPAIGSVAAKTTLDKTADGGGRLTAPLRRQEMVDKNGPRPSPKTPTAMLTDQACEVAKPIVPPLAPPFAAPSRLKATDSYFARESQIVDRVDPNEAGLLSEWEDAIDAALQQFV